MASEIERKFLVLDESWRARAGAGVRYRQAYLSSTEKCTVRVRIGGDSAWLNIKGGTAGFTREEFEYPVPSAEAERMLEHLSLGPVVEKTRYPVEVSGRRWEVDVFEGDNAGLVVAELELEHADDAFELPPWAGREVSEDPRYYNANLARRPFGTWHS